MGSGAVGHEDNLGGFWVMGVYTLYQLCDPSG